MAWETGERSRRCHSPESAVWTRASFGPSEYALRFARDASVRETEVARAAGLVTRVVRRHVSDGALDEALDVLPLDLSQLIEPAGEAIGRPARADQM